MTCQGVFLRYEQKQGVMEDPNGFENFTFHFLKPKIETSLFFFLFDYVEYVWNTRFGASYWVLQSGLFEIQKGTFRD